MSKDESSFIFYKDWADQLEDLDSETQLKFYKAIIAYATTGETPSDMGNLEMALFKGMKADIDRNDKKRDDIKQRRSEAGKMGGSKSKQNEANEANASFGKQTKQNEANEANASFGKQTKQNEANEANASINVNVNVNDNVNVPLYNGGVIIPAPAREENPENSSLSEKARAFVEFFNEKVHGTCIPQVKKMTEKREITIGRILHTMGRETMEDVIIKATSPSCILATENRGVGIDWFTKEDNVIKVIEGNYDNTRTSSQGSGLCKQETRHLQQLRELAGDDPERYAILEATYKNRG